MTALREEALARMREHGQAGAAEKPLFLYVSFNAAHAPLQAEQEWLSKCAHIPHHWRRQGLGPHGSHGRQNQTKSFMLSENDTLKVWLGTSYTIFG